MDFVKHFDLRRKELMRRFEFCLHNSLDANASVALDEATAALSPGIGQADIRNVTYEDGSPLFKNGRLWILMTVRGGGLPHPMQGVYSMNPSVFDIRFEGIILYDRGDGLLRNDLASNIFYDRTQKVWRGFITGFSSYGDPAKKEKKELWAVQSSREPLQGLSIMKAKATGLVGDYEDPQCIYDSQAGKWRVLLCENHKGYKAVIRESDHWDGRYERIARPVTVNSTGTQIQKIGQERYALFGSSDRKVYIYTYPDLEPVGELRMHRPPCNEAYHGGAPWYVMLREGQYKYARPLIPDDLEELYDLESDPEELDNLAVKPEFAEKLTRMRVAAIDELRRNGAGFVNRMPAVAVRK